MKKRILQSIANSILKRVEVAPNEEFVKLWYDIGLSFDNFCVTTFDIYLD